MIEVIKVYLGHTARFGKGILGSYVHRRHLFLSGLDVEEPFGAGVRSFISASVMDSLVSIVSVVGWQPEAQECTEDCAIADISCYVDSCP